jgi:hypothetical protein
MLGNIQTKFMKEGSAQSLCAFYCIKNLGERNVDITFVIIVIRLEVYFVLPYLNLTLL